MNLFNDSIRFQLVNQPFNTINPFEIPWHKHKPSFWPILKSWKKTIVKVTWLQNSILLIKSYEKDITKPCWTSTPTWMNLTQSSMKNARIPPSKPSWKSGERNQNESCIKPQISLIEVKCKRKQMKFEPYRHRFWDWKRRTYKWNLTMKFSYKERTLKLENCLMIKSCKIQRLILLKLS